MKESLACVRLLGQAAIVVALSAAIPAFAQQPDAAQTGQQLLQQLEALGRQRIHHAADAGDIAAGPRQALHQS